MNELDASDGVIGSADALSIERNGPGPSVHQCE